MKSVLMPLYWLWCGVSVFILVRRRVAKKQHDSATAAAGSGDVTTGGPVVSAAAAAAVLDDPFAVYAPDPPAEDAPADAASGAVTTVEASATRSSLPPPSGEARAISLGVPLSSVPSLAGALDGITLPCDLAPLTGTGDFDPRRLVLVADGRPADVVGRALADEIESLGFALTSLDERGIMARSKDATVEIRIHPDPTVVGDEGVRLFPTAPPDGVVVELTLR